MIKNERNKFLLTLISIALLCGSIFYKFFPDITVNSIIESKIFLLQTGSFLQILLFLIKLDIIFIAVTFFTGTSFIGSPIVFLPPFFKCLIIGYIGSYFYNVFELKGVLFCLLLIYPYFVVTTSSLIFTDK